MNKDFHSGHFCCWQCDESLTGQRYVLRDDHPFCIKCYENVFANTCDECHKIIGIDSKVSHILILIVFDSGLNLKHRRRQASRKVIVTHFIVCSGIQSSNIYSRTCPTRRNIGMRPVSFATNAVFRSWTNNSVQKPRRSIVATVTIPNLHRVAMAAAKYSVRVSAVSPNQNTYDVPTNGRWYFSLSFHSQKKKHCSVHQNIDPCRSVFACVILAFSI